MLAKNNKSYSESLDTKRQPLPFLEQKKIGAQAYVSERINRIRLERSKQKNLAEDLAEESFEKRWKEMEQIRQMKKNVILSSNKMIPNSQIVSSFEPFRKELDIMRKKPNSSINYEEILNNLHPFSNAIKQLGVYKIDDEKRKLKKKTSDTPATVNMYRSIPRKSLKKQFNSKPYSQSSIKQDQSYFLNVGKMSLLDGEQRIQRRPEILNKFPSPNEKRFSSLSIDDEQLSSEDIYMNRKFNKFPSKQSMTINTKDVNLQAEEKSNTLSPVKLPHVLSKESIKREEMLVSPTKKKKKKFAEPFETYYYRSMIWKVNYSNLMSVEIPHQYEHRLKVFIGKGNNSSLVKGLVKRRLWFAVTERIEDANFVWTQLKSLPFFRLQSKFEGNSSGPLEQQHSDEVVLQRQYYCSKFKYLSNKDQRSFKRYMDNFQASQERSDQRLLCRNKFFKYEKSIKIEDIRQTKMQNHLMNNYIIGNKKALFHTMSAYYSEKNQDVFDYLPLTFHVKEGLEDPVYYKFLKYFYKRAKQCKTEDAKDKDKNIWIVKPGQNSNRGSGIKVCLNLEEIKAILKKKQFYSDGTFRTWIIQSYIEKPLLYNKRKFDIRHYMMMSCVNGVVKGYWYQDGYVRTTSSEYQVKTNCSKIHLTNDAVQKNLPDYGKYEKGNKLSYDELENYILKITSKRKEPISFKQHLLPKMKKIATDAIRACSGSIDPERKQNNFEIFGLDFMIDANYKLYLIEINTNPCLELSCPLLSGIIPRFIENTLELTMDAQFPPPVRYYPKGMHYFKNLEEENRYSLVYDSRIEKLYTCGTDVIDEKLLEQEDDTFEDDGDEFDPDD